MRHTTIIDILAAATVVDLPHEVDITFSKRDGKVKRIIDLNEILVNKLRGSYWSPTLIDNIIGVFAEYDGSMKPGAAFLLHGGAPLVRLRGVVIEVSDFFDAYRVLVDFSQEGILRDHHPSG